MDRKEAIFRIKDHMEHHGIGEYPHLKLKEALDMAIAALDTPNEPLTIEQLREMDGVNALWLQKLVRGPHKPRLMLVHSVSDGWWTCCDFNGFATFSAVDYGVNYLLYRCLPEGEEDT